MLVGLPNVIPYQMKKTVYMTQSYVYLCEILGAQNQVTWFIYFSEKHNISISLPLLILFNY